MTATIEHAPPMHGRASAAIRAVVPMIGLSSRGSLQASGVIETAAGRKPRAIIQTASTIS